MRRRRLKLEDCGVSEYAYQELVYFCLQYKEKVKKLAWNRHALRPPPVRLYGPPMWR